MNQVAILQHFGKQEAVLEVIETTSICRINILQFCKPAAYTSRRVDCHKSIPRPVPVLLVTRRPVGVIETLYNFWTKDILAVGDEETGLFVESLLVRRWLRVIRVIGSGAVGDPAEDLGADACEGTDVGVVAAVDELQAKINVFLLFEGEAAEDERSAIETGNWLKSVCIERRAKGIGGITMLRLMYELLSVKDG